MIILATDAPLDKRQLERLCHRAAFGLARTGSACHGGSGDFVVAFSTGYHLLDRPEEPGRTAVYPRTTDHEQFLPGRHRIG
ncbi:MAG: P1 family peptidase [Chloroflexi bacterium]|nr:P1 family peptidase [Chloroflexota bacterium]